jgi:hypothetical protein
MIERVVQVHRLDGCSEIRQNLEYWLSRPTEERLAAVEELRRQFYGDSQRLQRVARVIQQATGRAKDAADIEALGEQ